MKKRGKQQRNVAKKKGGPTEPKGQDQFFWETGPRTRPGSGKKIA